MENTNFIVLITGLAGVTLIALKKLSANSIFKNSAVFLNEMHKKQNKIGEFEIKKLAEGLI